MNPKIRCSTVIIIVFVLLAGCQRPTPTQQTIASPTTALTATAIPMPTPTIAPTGTPLPDGPIDTADWPALHAASLGFSIRYPPGWEAVEREGIVYVHANERLGDGPHQLAYYIYIEEYPNPQELALEQVVYNLWPGSEAFFQSIQRQIGDHQVYESTRIPSAYGAKTIFFEDEGRYIAVALTPYDPDVPYVEQDKYDRLFEAMLLTFRLDAETQP